MKYKRLEILWIAILFVSLISCDKERESIDTKNHTLAPTMQQWQDQKFSMFIHWGIYSIPAGKWNDKQIKGYSEQIKGHAKISTEDYSKLTEQFNPIHWNADSIVALAKEAGMKSIVITSKHHDGFNMFDTKFSDFNIVDATPFKRDVIKELAASCKQNGLGFGVYFSLIDWNSPVALPFVSTRNSDSIPPLHHKYNLDQVEELLTNYGEVSEIWFDMGSPTLEQSKEIAELVKKLQPNCLISGRLWNDQGDFIVMGDNKQPNFKMGVPWQTPASMFDETWSYRSWQERGNVNLKIKEKIHDLLKIVSMGGNYLLNIGPKADGTVIPFEKQVLKGIGKWLSEYGESVYGTNTSPLKTPDWGVITSKPEKLYLHILNYPKDQKLVLAGLDANIRNIYPLSNKALSLKWKQQKDTLSIHLTDKIMVNEYATVIVVEYKGDVAYTPSNLLNLNKKNSFELSKENAEKYHSFSGHDYYSTRPTVVKMEWNLLTKSRKKYTMTVNFTPVDFNENLSVIINDKEYIIITDEASDSLNHNIFTKTIQDVELNDNIINKVSLQYKQPKNPHKGLPFNGIKIIFE